MFLVTENHRAALAPSVQIIARLLPSPTKLPNLLAIAESTSVQIQIRRLNILAEKNLVFSPSDVLKCGKFGIAKSGIYWISFHSTNVDIRIIRPSSSRRSDRFVAATALPERKPSPRCRNRVD